MARVRSSCGCAAGLVVLIALSCVGCDEQSATAAGGPASAQRQAQLTTGYGSLKLGASFEDVLASEGPSRFDSLSVSECIRDLPTKGCLLLHDERSLDLHEGIPYGLKLSFNRFGRVTDIGLDYEREGSSAECQSLHERTLDWAVREFGPFGYEPRRGSGSEVRKTPAGVAYTFYTSERGFLATLTPERSAGADDGSVRARRYLWSLSHFLVIDGKGYCGVEVTLSEPDSVERGKWVTDASPR